MESIILHHHNFILRDAAADNNSNKIAPLSILNEDEYREI